MAEFAFIHPSWVQHGNGTMTPSRLRSLTPLPMKKEISRSISVPQLQRAAQTQSESDGMNTIPDPRSATPQPTISRRDSTDSHPDLSQEVATLSTKLINAINHQTMLDDSLQQTRHELDAAREKLAMLEAQVKQHENKVAKGLLVESVVYNKMEKQLSSELHEERRRRTEAEKAKRKTDSEVEALTAALFEEANVMVASARKETEASDKRTEQLRQQLGDAGVLQHSLQEQLQDLKGVVEKMSSNSDDNESNTFGTTTAPSTPGATAADKMSKLFEAINLTPNTPGTDEISPDHPLHFSHLIHPVLRSDLTAFKEFQDMLKTSDRSSAPTSRASSGNYGSLSVLGLGSLANVSTSSLPSSIKSQAGNNSPRESVGGAGMPNLKDDKFYKRALIEDIEPTLRLDIAPGLSWMARRTVLSSITAGSLVVEPNPAQSSKWRTPVFPCSLCGETRQGDEYARKFRFKPADTEESQRYPLCDWCLGRVRATCDYIGFLRMVAAGHWRAETDEEQKTAWEESVRLRERMFWTRVGGGVVPAFVPLRDSPRSPIFAAKEGARTSEESQISNTSGSQIAADGTVATRSSDDDPFQTKDGDLPKRISIGNTIISADVKEFLTRDEEKKIEEQAEAQLQSEVQKSLLAAPVPAQDRPQAQRQRSASNPPLLQSRKKDDRLSLTIPGAFE
ncbi:Sec2p-domain-containing protein [Dothidotthia symphoricarpi CBS 119687]|uniref:Sec2p-domain-containing protein n=1 Tax=Dothidotthia symphoricarpi CBS 119687 TaxID=1392245 RepID=A0A6A6AL10_9PLEO|nr:Sec2p-domain-containing protein [Dothidotthia symphoricarpi CBS 119687]KAF2131883.1 Sec2p-domain-containing protein [Dothidotthia symphoricarpi CBS 119687]